MKVIQENQNAIERWLRMVFDFECNVYFKLRDTPQVDNAVKLSAKAHVLIDQHRLVELQFFDAVVDHHFDVSKFSNLIPQVGN